MFIDFRENKREGGKERKRDIDLLSIVCTPTGTGLQPRHMSRLGIEPLTFQCIRRHSNQIRHTSQGHSAFLSDGLYDGRAQIKIQHVASRCVGNSFNSNIHPYGFTSSQSLSNHEYFFSHQST